jgi:hypothetical protein
MTVRVWVEQQNGTFVATVIGEPHLKAVGVTKKQAVAALAWKLRESSSPVRVVLVDVADPGAGGISDLGGTGKEPPLREISDAELAQDAERNALDALSEP